MRRQWHPTPVLLPGKSHGRRSLVGCSPWGHKESDTTERLHFHLSLSCIGEGNGNPLQCSCLENPRDGGAWRAAVYGVAQSRTRLKWLSSSSSTLYMTVSDLGPPCLSVAIFWTLNTWPLANWTSFHHLSLICSHRWLSVSNIFLFFTFFFYFIFKLYIIVLVLPNIKMNPPQVIFLF